MKKGSASSARGERRRKSAGATKKPIDVSDIPELSDRQLARLHRIGRPLLGSEARRPISIRLDKRVLDWLRETAAARRVPYQSLINDILAREMKRAS